VRAAQQAAKTDSGRSYEEGKKIGWRDAVTALAAIIYYRFFD